MRRSLELKFERLKAAIVGNVMNPKMSEIMDQVDALKREFELDEQSQIAELRRINDAMGADKLYSSITVEGIVEQIDKFRKDNITLAGIIHQIRAACDAPAGVNIVAHVGSMKKSLDYFQNPWKAVEEIKTITESLRQELGEKLGKL